MLSIGQAVGGLIGFSSLTSIGYLYYADPRQSSVKRPITFWWTVGPILWHYRNVDSKTKDWSDEEREAEYTKLHQLYAPRIRDLFLQLRGIYVKMGQVGATRQDICPPAYREAFKVFLDAVPSKNGAEARQMAEAALGQNIDEIFESFDDEPLGAASVGQVHGAKLKSGRDVVVKVQYPEVRRMFGLDMAGVRFLGTMQFPERKPLIEEMERQLTFEFQFEREAWALQTVRQNLQSIPQVTVPEPVLELCTPTCVVMERFYGRKLTDEVMENMQRRSALMGYSSPEEMRDSMMQPAGKWQQLWRRTKLLTKYASNTTRGHVGDALGKLRGKRSVGDWKVTDMSKMYEYIVKAHGHQVFVDGVFNGDPHMGNIWVLEDGRVGLIDYGQVKVLPVELRERIHRLYKDIRAGRKEEAVAQFVEMGYQSRYNNPDVTWQRLQLILDRDDIIPRGMSPSKFMRQLEGEDPLVTYPEDLLLLTRMAMLLRGLGHMVKPGQGVCLTDHWSEYLDT